MKRLALILLVAVSLVAASCPQETSWHTSVSEISTPDEARFWHAKAADEYYVSMTLLVDKANQGVYPEHRWNTVIEPLKLRVFDHSKTLADRVEEWDKTGNPSNWDIYYEKLVADVKTASKESKYGDD